MNRLRVLLALMAMPVVYVTMASAGGELAPALRVPASSAQPAGAVRYGSGWAVPLKSGVPLEWYTPALRQRVRSGVPVSAPGAAPRPPEPGIRPGSWMVEPYACTLGWLFRKDGALAASTAGHCVDRVGDRVVILTRAPDTGDAVLLDIGVVIERHAGGIGDDFALIEIRPALRRWADAAAAVVGGPCGEYRQERAQTVVYYGHGVGTKGGEPQSGAAARWRTQAFGWDTHSVSGDSGSPVRLTDFSAAGLLTHVVTDDGGAPSFVAGTRIAQILQAAPGWSLAESRLCLKAA
ncbi:MAG TPA: hypothetical protein VM369_00835 [Candidatus Binatia bacterium]|nr:hypothetical protein [Candidatus Binatia bacterium]